MFSSLLSKVRLKIDWKANFCQWITLIGLFEFGSLKRPAISNHNIIKFSASAKQNEVAMTAGDLKHLLNFRCKPNLI